MSENRPSAIRRGLVAAAVGALLGSGLTLHLAWAQQAGIKRTDLQRHDLGVPGREAVQGRVDLDPGVAFGDHMHPGEGIIYVLEGTLEHRIEGKPPVTLKAGDRLFIPTGTIHAAKNIGSGNPSELATYIVGKGQAAAHIREVTARSLSIPAAKAKARAANLRRCGAYTDASFDCPRAATLLLTNLQRRPSGRRQLPLDHRGAWHSIAVGASLSPRAPIALRRPSRA